MAFIGKLIKTGINLNRKLRSDPEPAGELQHRELTRLLQTAKDTAFGKYYGFADMLESDDVVGAFRREVPIHDYDAMHRSWWAKQAIHSDITWPGKPEFFALSSGTTGKSSKKLPITGDFLHSMRKVGTTMITSLPNFDFPEELFESEILMLSSSARLQTGEGGHREGEISGINVSNFPGWYDLFYRPGKEIATIPDWDRRVDRIAEEAPEWNIGAVAGIPSWVLLMIRRIMERHQLESIHEIWPNFSVFVSGGVAFETYRKDFDSVASKPIRYLDTYLASEGFFAYTARPETLDMRLALEHGYYYEFIPFDSRGVDEMGNILEKPVVHGIDEVEEGCDYVLVVSTCAGAWRYVIGDTIRFTDLPAREIKITGRTKFFLNVVGSQLSEEKLDAAILEVSDELQVSVNEYAVAAVKNEADEFIHQWVIISEDDFEADTFAEKLDRNLQNANKNYRVARSKALKGIAVARASKEQYHGYLKHTKKKGGQVKTPKVMVEDKMRKFLEFIAMEEADAVEG